MYAKLYGDYNDLGEKGMKCTAIGFGIDESPDSNNRLEGQMSEIILLSGPKACAIGTGMQCV